MKKTLAFVLIFAIFCMVGCDRIGGGETVGEDFPMPLGDTGITVKLPAEVGFEALDSKYNDFFGRCANGEWCINANVDEKDGYTLAEYATACAEANGSQFALQDKQGDYYFIYVNEDEGYKFYTAVREGTENFYRVSFYCDESSWSYYEADFAAWASTIEVK